jgi:hypothetical protein
MNLYQPTITGSLAVSGSVIVNGTVTATSFSGLLTGTASLATTASYAVVATSASHAASASNALAAQSASYVLNAVSSSYILNAQSASIATTALTASFVENAQTASYVLNAVSSSFALTASSADNLLVRNTLTAQTLVVQTITSSVDFVTGSTRFGSILGNTHVFSGSVTMNPGGLFVSSSGLVGIGTTTPSYLLDVRSSASSGAPIVGNFQSAGGDAQLYVSNGSVITQLTADNTNSISIVGSMTNHPLVIRTNNAERMRIASGGGVKIFGNLESLILQATTVNSEIYLGLYNSAGSRRCYIGYGATPTTTLDLWNTENGAIKFGTNNTEKVRITSAGNVGINYSDPDAFVASSGYGNLVVGSGAGNQGITIFSGTASSSGLMFADATSGTGAYTGYILYSHLSDKIEIATGGGTPRLTIDSSGRVTKPYQPAFNAGKNTNSSVSAGATVVFQLTTGDKFNVGGHYNASTGIFTAPVAGIYDFSASIIWMNVPNGTAMDDSFWIYKNSNIVAYGLRRAEYESTYTGNGGYYVDFANVLLSLAVGDTVKVVNNRALEIHGNTAYSYFQGYMLG